VDARRYLTEEMMNDTAMLALAMASFVGTHLLMSHPFRHSLVARLGEGPFLGIYSLVSVLTLGWVVWARLTGDPGELLWVADPWLWELANFAMLIADILLVGSLLGNPAFPDPRSPEKPIGDPRGVFAITRHPMLWSFMIWALVHGILWGSVANLIVAAGIFLLSLVGALGQDAKKLALQGTRWKSWMDRTAFLPFAGQFGGRIAWREIWPGWTALLGGLALLVIATWAHPVLGGPPAGIWRWAF